MSEGDDLESLRSRIATLETELHAKRESEAFLDALLEAVPSIVMRVDEELRLLHISRVVDGFSEEQVLGTSLLDYMPESDRIKTESCIRGVLATGLPGQYQIEGFGAGGSLAFYDAYVASVPEPSGRKTAVLVAIDVTAHRMRERALDESKKTLELAHALTGLGIWSWDLDTNRVEWNEPMYRLTGLDQPVTAPEYVERLVHPLDKESVAKSATMPFGEGTFQRPPHRIIRPDGEVRWVSTSGRVFSDESGRQRKIVGASLDVTDQRRFEEHMQRTQRLEAVGQLAAGVAHNFNNMLATILPVLDLVHSQVTGPYQSLVDDARHSGARATELVRQLTAFAGRREATARIEAQAGSVVGRAIDLCRRVLGGNVALSFVDHADDTWIRCDAGAIEQAVVNIVLNARDAIIDAPRNRGAITVEVDVPENSPDLVRIRIADDGCGMTEETRHRVFEPFFTTKEVGRGTGLGLAMTYATVKEHGGSIQCDSAPERGTTFEIVLPRIVAPRRTPSQAPAHTRRSTDAKVLLVDDDAGVRNALTLLLEDFGYGVFTTPCPDAALEIANAQTDIRLVLLDRSIKASSSDSLVAALRKALPRARLVYFTGDDVNDADAKLVDGVLAKPASLSDIDQLLAE